MFVFIAAVTTALVVSFMCSIFESVLLSIPRAQVESLANSGKRTGIWLKGFKRNMDVPIAAILIVNTVAHTIGAAVAGASYVNVFAADTLWVFSIVFTIAVLLITEIIPKTLGVSYAGRLAHPVAYGIRFLTIALKPFVFVSERISRSLRGNAEVPVTSIEEIRLLAALGRSEGVVGARTAGIIVGATQLTQLKTFDVMLPRHRVEFLSAEHTLAENLDIVRKSGHSRFPLSPTSELDSVSGIVLAKELLFEYRHHDDSQSVDFGGIVREPLIVPGSQPLNRLLRTFREAQSHLAIVVDEYGAVRGIATLEDVLEEIVGDIVDESDAALEYAWPQPDGSLHVHASTELRRVAARLGIDIGDDLEAVSLGGLVTNSLGRIPVQGDVVEWSGCRISVLSASPKRPELVSIVRI